MLSVRDELAAYAPLDGQVPEALDVTHELALASELEINNAAVTSKLREKTALFLTTTLLHLMLREKIALFPTTTFGALEIEILLQPTTPTRPSTQKSRKTQCI